MLFFKTSIFVFLTAILVGALSIPEDAERDLVERNTCKGPDGYSLTCSGK
jgi:hypothetical protein